MADVNFSELFGNFSAADALAATETKKSSGYSGNENLYKPNIKDEKCTDMNYRALIRFIPFFHEGKWRTTLARWECFLKDVNGENGIFVVSPKTDNDKRRCPMRSLSYQLYKSDSAIDQANSKKIQVYQQYYALVEVVKDAQHPEYEGKHFIYQFGQKIADKIEAAMKDSEYSDGFNPFALFDGRLFEINLKKDSQKKMDNGKPVTDYEGCRFTEKKAPIHFKVDDEVVTLTKDDTSTQKAFLNWLETTAPKMTDYMWKEWDSETTEKVNSLLATYKSGYTAPRSTKAAAQEAVNIVNGDEDEKSDSEPKADPKQKAQAKKTPDPVIEDDEEEEDNESSVSEDDDAWINSVLNG